MDVYAHRNNIDSNQVNKTILLAGYHNESRIINNNILLSETIPVGDGGVGNEDAGINVGAYSNNAVGIKVESPTGTSVIGGSLLYVDGNDLLTGNIYFSYNSVIVGTSISNNKCSANTGGAIGIYTPHLSMNTCTCIKNRSKFMSLFATPTSAISCIVTNNITSVVIGNIVNAVNNCVFNNNLVEPTWTTPTV